MPVFVRRIAVIGTGYVCLTTEACLASLRYRVVCADVDEGKVARLSGGELSILEPGPPELVAQSPASDRAAALVVLTERPEFRMLDLGRLAELVGRRIVVDTRSLLDADVLHRVGFEVRGVGGPDRPRFTDPLQVRQGVRN